MRIVLTFDAPDWKAWHELVPVATKMADAASAIAWMDASAQLVELRVGTAGHKDGDGAS